MRFQDGAGEFLVTPDRFFVPFLEWFAHRAQRRLQDAADAFLEVASPSSQTQVHLPLDVVEAVLADVSPFGDLRGSPSSTRPPAALVSRLQAFFSQRAGGLPRAILRADEDLFSPDANTRGAKFHQLFETFVRTVP